MALRRSWLWVGGCGVAAWCAIATAQTVYKWTDAQGVVHFADTPPSEVGKVEERHLSPPRPAKPREEPPAAAPAANTEAPTTQGSAQVIVASRRTPRTSVSAVHVTGEVKNVGAGNAERVAVTVSAVDSQQGMPCLSEEIAVRPPTLRPGESGTFDAEVDSPCLIGQSTVDIAPVWD